MPRPDPVPTPRGPALRRFARIMRWMALLAIGLALTAVWLVARDDAQPHIHMTIATAVGVGLTVLLATGLISLSYLSRLSGHDDQARFPPQEDRQ